MESTTSASAEPWQALHRDPEARAETAERRFLDAVHNSMLTFNRLAGHLKKSHREALFNHPMELGVQLSYSEQVLKDGNSAASNIRERYFDLMNEVNPAKFAFGDKINPEDVLKKLERVIKDVEHAQTEIEEELTRTLLIMQNIKKDHRAFINSQKDFMEGLRVGSGVAIQDIPWASRKRHRHWDRAEDESRVEERGDRFYA